MYEAFKAANPRRNAQNCHLSAQCTSIIVVLSMCAFFGSRIVRAQEAAQSGPNRTQAFLGRSFFETSPTTPLQLSMTAHPDFTVTQEPQGPAVQPIDSRPMDVSRENLKPALGDDAFGRRGGTLSMPYAPPTKDTHVKIQGRSSSLKATEAASYSKLRGQDFHPLAAILSIPPPEFFYSLQDVQRASTYDTGYLTDNQGTLLYQIGHLNLVIKQLPDSCSLSPASSRSSVER